MLHSAKIIVRPSGPPAARTVRRPYSKGETLCRRLIDLLFTRRRPQSPTLIGAAPILTQIELLWDRYVACRADKRAVYAAYEAAETNGTDDDVDRAEALYDEALKPSG